MIAARFGPIALLLLASSDHRARAEDPPPPAGAEVRVRQVDERRFPEIALDFELAGPDGRPILDAPREAFRVVEDGRPVEVLEFASPVSVRIRPATVVLVVDKSTSMRQEDRMGALKRAVAAFLESQPEGSTIAVIAFGSDVELICDFTDDPERVRRAVNRLRALGTTRFYDAVERAIALLEGREGRRAIVALTDGEDTASREADLESAVAAARAAGLPIHTVGVGSEEEIESESLIAMAEATRGRYFAARDAAQLVRIYEEIARSLKETYALTYRTARPLQDGTLRPIEVRYLPIPAASGRAEVFIRGIVAPVRGWSGLFVALLAVLAALAALPGALRRAYAV